MPKTIFTFNNSPTSISGKVRFGNPYVPPYSIGGASPELVAAFLTAANGTTEGEYFRTSSSDTDFSMFTFSRSGLATMFDSTGTLVWAPHNFAEDSQDISQWSAMRSGGNPFPVVTANAAEAPDGTMTADLVVFNKTVDPSSFCRVGSSASPLIVDVEYTLRFWARTSDGTSKTAYLQPLSTDLGIEYPAITGDWQLFEYTFTATGTSSTVLFGLRGTNSDDTLSVYFWGCHVYRSDLGGMADNPDQPAGLEKYVPTTSAAVYLPRRNAYYYDSGWTKGGLQLESAAATNLITYSNLFDGTGEFSAVASYNTVVTNDDATLNGLSFSAVEVATGETSCGIQTGTTDLPGVDTEQRVFSVFLEGGSGVDTLDLVIDAFTNNATEEVDLSAGTITSADPQTDAAGIEHLGGNVYRVWLAVTMGADVAGRVRILSNVTQSPGDFFRVAGAQWEEGSFPTSYIPTNVSTVTRAAETLSIAAADLPYSATAMSIFASCIPFPAAAVGLSRPFFWSASSNDELFVNFGTNTSSVRFRHDRGGNTTAEFSAVTFTPGATEKVAGVWTADGVTGSYNGAASVTATGATGMPAVSATDMDFGYDFNGFISEFRMWGTDIGDSGIEEVTS